jgi:hypothetical protein
LIEVIEALLEFIHMSAMIYFRLGPPGVSQLVEVWVGEPELFKVEGFGPGGDTQVQTEGDRPVVRPCFWHYICFHGLVTFEEGFSHEKVI